MTAVRDSLCNLEPVQIPRPQISGLQFIPTRGRLGFYKVCGSVIFAVLICFMASLRKQVT